jgi:endonuclease/exonuclease/phosphatase family metal-dependent hydrolase
MTIVRHRPRLCTVCALFLYIATGFSCGGIGALEVPLAAEACLALPTAAAHSEAGGEATTLSVLQGNLWMLPVRRLLVPYDFSTDRKERLERFIRVVRSCEPEVVLLQEVFERSVVSELEVHLPGYTVLTSGDSDFTGTLNASGLVTLTRLPVGDVTYREFSALPPGSRPYELMARKGVLAVDVEVDGVATTILNVHLYGSSFPESAVSTRMNQLAEVLALVRGLEAAELRVLVGGDFNIGRDELASTLPDGWRVSEHGPTYDPSRNPYTVQGANDTAGNHEDRRLGRGAQTIDLLLGAPLSGVELASTVVGSLLVSDHQLVYHVVTMEGQ